MNFLDLVKARCSVRSYEPRPVEQEKLDYFWNVYVWLPRQ